MRIRAGHGRPAGHVRDMGPGTGRGRQGGRGADGQSSRLVALGQDLDRQVGAEALTQAAADAVLDLDDGVVRQDQACLGAYLDADIAAFAPLVDPSDVDVVDKGGIAMYPGGLSVWR